MNISPDSRIKIKAKIKEPDIDKVLGFFIESLAVITNASASLSKEDTTACLVRICGIIGIAHNNFNNPVLTEAAKKIGLTRKQIRSIYDTAGKMALSKNTKVQDVLKGIVEGDELKAVLAKAEIERKRLVKSGKIIDHGPLQP